MIGLSHIYVMHVPLPLVLEAHSNLREIGKNSLEGFALWAGTIEGDVFYVRKTIIPIQRGFSSRSGVYVKVDGAELSRINMWLYENEMTLIAQIHTHPSEAYHSEMDDSYPIVTTVGGFSLVIPNFAMGPFDFSKYVVFRLSDGGWKRLSHPQVNQLIKIME